jgi:hypothetical protein
MKFLEDIALPAPETEKELSAFDIMEKIRSFYRRFNQIRDAAMEDNAEHFFLQLLAEYPQSMCSRNFSDTLKLIASLIYHQGAWSVEDLSIIFDRSKATIFAAIHDKEVEARDLLRQYNLKKQTKSKPSTQLTEEVVPNLSETKQPNK